MATKFTNLTIPLIDEGRFEKQVEADFLKLQQAMVEYAKKHGKLAFKSKGELTIKIQVHCDSPDDFAFSIRAFARTTVPGSPQSFSVAMGEIGADDQPTLFVRTSGSSVSPPQQGILSTQDGRAVIDGRIVDTKTGQDLGPAEKPK